MQSVFSNDNVFFHLHFVSHANITNGFKNSDKALTRRNKNHKFLLSNHQSQNVQLSNSTKRNMNRLHSFCCIDKRSEQQVCHRQKMKSFAIVLNEWALS